MKLLVSSVIILASCFIENTLADSRIEDLLRRVEELENQQNELLLNTQEPRPSVSSFINDNLTFGGFFEPAYLIIDGPDTKLQSSYTSSAMGLNIAAEFQSNIRFVSQLVTVLTFPLENPHNDPRGETKSLPNDREFSSFFIGSYLTQAYLEYSFGQHLIIQGGSGFVPFANSFQLREPVLFIRRGGPQLLRTTNIVSPLWSGIHISGTTLRGKGRIGYNLYTHSPVSNPKAPGVGARVWLESFDDQLISGISLQHGRTDKGAYEAIGLDLRLELSNFLIKTEIAQHHSRYSDPWSAHLEPAIYLSEEILLYLFGDYAFSSLNTTGSNPGLEDPYQKWEYGMGVNWLPTTYTRLRMGVTVHDYVGNSSIVSGQNRDYYSLDISAGVAF